MKFVWIGAIFFSLSVLATTVPPKVTTPQHTSKWSDWPSDILESQYISALTEKYGGKNASAEDRILITYLEYLKSKDAKKGSEFIAAFKELATLRPVGAKSAVLSLFDGGAADRCWPQAFNGKPFCSMSIGTFTFKFLPSLVKLKDKPAMELLALYPALHGKLDGAEADAYESFVKDWANSRRHWVMLKEIRAAHPQFKAKAYTASLD